MPGGVTRKKAGVLCLALASLSGYLALSIQPAFAASVAINSAGPLTKIEVSGTLNCSVNYLGDAQGAFLGDTACGTFLAAGGKFYGPSSVPGGPTAGSTPNYLAFTPAGPPPALTGTGTAADPFKIVTNVDAGSTGLHLTETDTYIVGQETYRTDVTVTNTGGQTSFTLYRAGDCNVGDVNHGFGALNTMDGTISCVGTNGVTPPAPIAQWRPLTNGSAAMEGPANNVWQAVASGAPFPNTCACGSDIDNGAGLSWSTIAPPGTSITLSDLATFSPTGRVPLVTTKTADSGMAGAGAADGYTIKITNPNAAPAALNSISDTLPPSFVYTPGSTTGLTTADPAISGQTLTWTGSLLVPGSGSATLKFGVVVPQVGGIYLNNATADAGTMSVVPTGDAAPIQVAGGTVIVTTTTSTTSTTLAGGATTTTSTTSPGATTTSTSTSTTSTTVAGGTTTTVAGGDTTTTVAGGDTTTTAAGGGTTATTVAGSSGGGTTATTAAGTVKTASTGTLAFTGSPMRRLLSLAAVAFAIGGVLLLVEWRKGLWHIGQIPPVRRPRP